MCKARSVIQDDKSLNGIFVNSDLIEGEGKTVPLETGVKSEKG